MIDKTIHCRVRSKNIVIVVFATLLLNASVHAVNNPFSRVDGINDCGVMKYNGEYYIQGNWLNGDMLSSGDLQNWGNRTHVIDNVGSWAPDHPGNPLYVHASHPVYVDGVFHLYFGMDSKIGHATGTNPWGMYTEPNPSTYFALDIDPAYFRDEDGKSYFYKVRFVSGNQIWGQTMADPYTFTGSENYLLSAINGTWEKISSTPINEGPWVIKYRGKYHMFYNANGTGDTDYQIGCAQADTPLGFSNSGKQSQPVLPRKFVGPNSGEINTIGQPWAVRGNNGFEWWIGYFAIYTTDGGGRYQYIDRGHFFDKKVYVDGPTNRYTAGYHPGPAKPQYRGLFGVDTTGCPDGWTANGGHWYCSGGQLRQDASGIVNAMLNNNAAKNYLFEINLKFIGSSIDQQAGLRVYYTDENNWMIVGIHQTSTPGVTNFYYHLREGGVDNVQAIALLASFNINVYHKLRVERNGNKFIIWLDDVIYAPVDTATASGFGQGQVGIFSNNANVAFDGIVYTVGWDEYDSSVQSWGASISGVQPTGNWTVAADGITQSVTSGSHSIFKGDLMSQYEFSVQVTKFGSVDGTMGIMPVEIDSNNCLGAEINLATDKLFIYGVNNGVSIPYQEVSVANLTTYNLRAVKLSDRIILFVDGQEKMTVLQSFGPSQVGLTNQNMAAKYNGILVYRIEPQSVSSPWQSADIGAVGFTGSADYFEGSFAISGSGGGVWQMSNQFQYVYQTFTGNGEIVARVDNLDSFSFWSRAGLMMRETLSPDSRFVLSNINGGKTDIQHIWHTSSSSSADYQVIDNAGAYSLPQWLKLKRQGDSFISYRSSDGINWTQAGSCTLSMNSTLYVGMSVTASDNTQICKAVFDNVTVKQCASAIPGDIDGDCAVSSSDLQLLAQSWLDFDGPDTYLLGYWKFDGDALDSSGNNHNGTLVGSTNYTTDAERGQVLGLTGGYVDIPLNVSETDFAISLWFKTFVASRGIFEVRNNDGSAWDRDIYLSNTNVAAYLWTGTSGETIVTSSGSYANNAWHHLVYSFGGNNGAQKLYIDGQLRASGAASSSAFTGDTKMLIGYSKQATSPAFAGYIDEVRVYNKSLPYEADTNKDMAIDLKDFAVMAANWLNCGIIPVELCP
jgi:regulation of enolase protein 1 (concanavalin A-like superfamily)